jgi:hypothetical protein
MNAKHTPGPWTHGVHDETLIVGGGRVVAEVWGYAPTDHERMEVDARLIAAAPEMLEALQRALPEIAVAFGPESEVVAECRAAIAKAEGRK